MQSIKDWLAGVRNYNEGVELYMRFGEDKAFKEMFREGKTAFKEKKLVELLRKLIVKSSELKVEEKEKERRVAADVNTNGWPAEMDTQLQALWNEWKPKFAEFNNLTHRLYDVAQLGKEDSLKEMEAGTMAHRILDLRDEIKEIYFARDHYLEHRTFPAKQEPFTPIVAGDVKVAERRLNVLRYLRRYYKQIQQPAEEGSKVRINQVKKYDQLVQELRWLNKQLNKTEDEGIPGKAKQADNSEGKDKAVPD